MVTIVGNIQGQISVQSQVTGDTPASSFTIDYSGTPNAFDVMAEYTLPSAATISAETAGSVSFTISPAPSSSDLPLSYYINQNGSRVGIIGLTSGLSAASFGDSNNAITLFADIVLAPGDQIQIQAGEDGAFTIDSLSVTFNPN